MKGTCTRPGASLQKMAMVSFRRAVPEDKPERLRVTQEAWRAAYTEFMPASLMEALWKGEVHESSSYGAARVGEPVRWIAEVDGRVAGHVGLIRRMESDIEVGEVSPLYVSPDFQGLGIGKSLLGILEDYMGEIALAELWVFALAQGPAIPFYRRHGFEHIRLESLRIGNAEFEVSAMRKSLGEYSAR